MPVPSGTPSSSSVPVRTDPNATNLSSYKGEIVPCPHCTTLESKLSQSACRFCMSRRYLATCTNCNGTGKVTAGSVWDGGRSAHTSTCNPCGGQGFYPATEADYNFQESSKPTAAAVQSPALTARPLPRMVQPMNNLEVTRFPKR